MRKLLSTTLSVLLLCAAGMPAHGAPPKPSGPATYAQGGESPPMLFDVRRYGAKGDGTTDDTAAVTRAVAALNAAGAGTLFFPAGTYKTAGGFVVTVPATVSGEGSGNVATGASWTPQRVSLVTCTSPTATLFKVTSMHARFEHLALLNTSTPPPTAGAGIVATTPNLPGSPSISYHASKVDYDDIYVSSFWTNIDSQSGTNWTLHNSSIIDWINLGLQIRNLNTNDGGDWNISDSVFAQGDHRSSHALYATSSGGGKIVNTKFNGSFDNGIYVNLTPANNTSILLVSNVSVENNRGNGIDVENIGLVNLNGVQFGMYGNHSGYPIYLSNAGRVNVDNVVAQNDGPSNIVVGINNSSCVTVGNISARDYSYPLNISGTYTGCGTPRFNPVVSEFRNGWSNLGGAFETAGYGYVNGRVELKGTVAGGRPNATVLVLPPGFRPTKTRVFPAWSNNTPCAVSVDAAGNLTPSGCAANASLSLDGVSFVP
jgi:hypothetical protein